LQVFGAEQSSHSRGSGIFPGRGRGGHRNPALGLRLAVAAAVVSAFFAVSLSAGTMGDGPVTAASTEPSAAFDDTPFITAPWNR